LEILSFDTLPSTQQYLIEAIRSGVLKSPVAVIASEQTAGVGSRENSWTGGRGNFFASIAWKAEALPEDLPPASVSIYMAFLMKKSLQKLGAEVWLKWPNDLYHAGEKVGGVISKKLSDLIVVGIGVNLKKNPNGYSALDTDISPLILLNIFLEALEKNPTWKEVFSQYKIEFDLSKSYFTHQNGRKIEMKHAILCEDGSLDIDGGKVYSLR